MAGAGRERGVTGTAGPPGLIRAGDRVVVDGRPRVVLGASGALIRFADDDGAVEEASVAELAGSGRLRLQPRGTGWNPGSLAGLAAGGGRVVHAGQASAFHVIGQAGR